MMPTDEEKHRGEIGALRIQLGIAEAVASSVYCARREVKRLRASLATAQAERDDARHLVDESADDVRHLRGDLDDALNESIIFEERASALRDAMLAIPAATAVGAAAAAAIAVDDEWIVKPAPKAT